MTINNRSQFPRCWFLDPRSIQKILLIRKVKKKKKKSWLRILKGSSGMLLKLTSKPLDSPLIVLICILAHPVCHKLFCFCKLKSKFSVTRLYIHEVIERKSLQLQLYSKCGERVILRNAYLFSLRILVFSSLLIIRYYCLSIDWWKNTSSNKR